MLSIRDLQVYYGKIPVLNIDQCSVMKGEIVALVGANGAGKSTLLKTVSGQVESKSGRIVFNGESIENHAPEFIVSKGLIQVPEGRQLFPALTVFENLMMGAFRVRNKGVIRKNLERVYNLFPILLERTQNYAQTLSGGEQQMLAIARALMSEPPMLMLDEPSLGIAPILVDEIFKVIQQLNEAGLPILIVEQNVFMSLSVSQRGYVLERGKIVLDDQSKTLLENKEVEQAYLGI